MTSSSNEGNTLGKSIQKQANFKKNDKKVGCSVQSKVKGWVDTKVPFKSA